MGLFDLFGKKAGAKLSEEAEGSGVQEGLEIYSGMRVEVTTFDDQLLFVAKLMELEGDTAELYQYSELGAPLNGVPFHVKIRGYSACKRKAVYMEGFIAPELKHMWRVESLIVRKVENDRAFFRLNVNVDASVIGLPPFDAAEKACRLVNISIGGAYIFSEEKYAIGSKFMLRVKLLEDRPESVLLCEVLRVIEKDEEAGYEFGCRFLEITEEDQQNITQDMFAIQSKKLDIC